MTRILKTAEQCLSLIDGMTLNFGAGPSKLPQDVLAKLADSLIMYKTTGVSIVELSHRSPQFQELFEETKNSLRELLDVPDSYEILLMQGGATTQFSAIPLNIIEASQHTGLINNYGLTPPYYSIDGYWSQKASMEARKYFTILGNDTDKNSRECLPSALYYHYCANETAEGIRVPFPDNVPESVPIFCDMSSFIFSEPIDVARYGCIYFGAQKNCGISGVTAVIIRKNLIKHPRPACPTTLNYKLAAEKGIQNFTVNTPSIISIYGMYLTLQWIKEQMGETGTLLFDTNKEKARRLYEFLDSDDDVTFTVPKERRSLTNVTFNHVDAQELVIKAKDAGIIGIAGHPSQGGLRVSLYNSITLEAVAKLIDFLETQTTTS